MVCSPIEPMTTVQFSSMAMNRNLRQVPMSSNTKEKVGTANNNSAEKKDRPDAGSIPQITSATVTGAGSSKSGFSLKSASNWSASRIRSRFYQRIGIDCCDIKSTGAVAKRPQAYERRKSRNAPLTTLHQPLEVDHDSENGEEFPPSSCDCLSTSYHSESNSRRSSSYASSSCFSSSSSIISCNDSSRSGRSYISSSSKAVSFDSSVTIYPIPMRSDYSDRIKPFLWPDRWEYLQNTARNAFEFASEEWDWRNAAEDEDMFIFPETGELIHSVHVAVLQFHAVSRRRDFFLQKSRERAMEWSS